MPFYKWSESMSVGVSLLDEDNKHIIFLINKLFQTSQHGTNSDIVGETFDNLIACFEFHFSREEKIMEACGYPFTRAHQDEHVIIIEYLYQSRSRWMCEGDRADRNALLHYLRSWLNHHILILDMGYVYFVRNNPAADKIAHSFGSWTEKELEDGHRLPTTVGEAGIDAF